MASFCTKCGAALSSDERFCTSCGTPVAAVGAVTETPAPSTPQYSQPYAPPAAQYQQPYGQPPPASSGGGALKIILIIIGVIVGLGILCVLIFTFAVGSFIHHAVKVDGNGGKVTLSTPGGTFSANTNENFTASDLGVDVYPGAQGVHGGVRMNTPNGSMISAAFATSDSKDQVVAYYKQKLGSDVSVYDSGNGAVVTVNKGQEESIIVTVSPNSSQDGGKTRISIVHSKSNKGS